MKFINIEMVTGYIATVGLPMAAVIFWVSTLVEVGAAIALILGFKTKIAAWALFVFTALTIVFFHNQLGDQAQLTMALKNLAIMGGLLFVIAYEAGMAKKGEVDPIVQTTRAGFDVMLRPGMTAHGLIACVSW